LYSCARLPRRCWRRWRRRNLPPADKQRELAARGIAAHLFDRDRRSPMPTPSAGTTHLLSSVPPDDAGDPCWTGTRKISPGWARSWAGYLSTTGVYGDHGGGWVDEDTAADAERPARPAPVAAEDAWLAFAGGPERRSICSASPGFTDRAATHWRRCGAGNARRVEKLGQVFSRIHRDDIVQARAGVDGRARPGVAYNSATTAARTRTSSPMLRMLGARRRRRSFCRRGVVADGAQLL
jgi:hypothetical protein